MSTYTNWPNWNDYIKQIDEWLIESDEPDDI